MSSWTYINGIINISCRAFSTPQARYVIETVLEHLPVVSGSEGNMEINLIERGGDRSSYTNEFGQPADNFNCADEWGNYVIKNDYALYINGSLRDRKFNDTLKEFYKWMNRLSKRLMVFDALVKIYDMNGNEYILNDNGKYYNMFEHFSWEESSNGIPAWTEYLYWEYEENTGYPKLLYKKLFKKNK